MITWQCGLAKRFRWFHMTQGQTSNRQWKKNYFFLAHIKMKTVKRTKSYEKSVIPFYDWKTWSEGEEKTSLLTDSFIHWFIHDNNTGAKRDTTFALSTLVIQIFNSECVSWARFEFQKSKCNEYLAHLHRGFWRLPCSQNDSKSQRWSVYLPASGFSPTCQWSCPLRTFSR